MTLFFAYYKKSSMPAIHEKGVKSSHEDAYTFYPVFIRNFPSSSFSNFNIKSWKCKTVPLVLTIPIVV